MGGSGTQVWVLDHLPHPAACEHRCLPGFGVAAADTRWEGWVFFRELKSDQEFPSLYISFKRLNLKSFYLMKNWLFSNLYPFKLNVPDGSLARKCSLRKTPNPVTKTKPLDFNSEFPFLHPSRRVWSPYDFWKPVSLNYTKRKKNVISPALITLSIKVTEHWNYYSRSYTSSLEGLFPKGFCASFIPLHWKNIQQTPVFKIYFYP